MIVTLGSITRGVIAHGNSCTYLWLYRGRLELDALFTIVCKVNPCFPWECLFHMCILKVVLSGIEDWAFSEKCDLLIIFLFASINLFAFL
jgi:hypothetical protein